MSKKMRDVSLTKKNNLYLNYFIYVFFCDGSSPSSEAPVEKTAER